MEKEGRRDIKWFLVKRWHLRTVDLLHLGYISITGLLIIIFHNNQPHWTLHLGIRFFLAVGIMVLNWRVAEARRPRFFWRLLRDWYTPLAFIYYYEETEPLSQLIIPIYFDFVKTHWAGIFAPRLSWLWHGGFFLDPFLEHWDGIILGFQPAVEFCRRFPSAWFSELMNFGYFSYYSLIPLLGFVLWFRGRQREFDTFMVKVSINMLWCYLFFIIFPSAGPKSYFPGAHNRVDFNGYFFKETMDVILKYGGISNGAFPSSHIAMATVILLCARRYEPLIFWIMLPLFLLLSLSTVYLREHYFVDVPAGILVGIFFYAIGDWAKRKFDNWLINKAKL